MDHGADFQRLFDESPDELLALLPDRPRYTAVAASKASVRALQAPPERIIGRGLREFFPDGDPAAAAALLASLDRVLDTRLPDTMPVERAPSGPPGPSGPAGPVAVRYRRSDNIPILSPSGEVRYILHRTLDVTEWMAEIERARRELRDFSRSVTHDLRGPLHSIDGFSELLLEENAGQLSEEARERLRMVRGAAQRMAELLEGLASYARANRGELRRMNFDLATLARSTVAKLQAEGAGRAVKITLPQSLPVEGDPHLLDEVLRQLLANAWKFTSQRADAEIEFGSATADGEVLYHVRDNGVGFDMSAAASLFGVFQRLHPDHEFPGKGIGLATVQRIVERHGGRVWAVGEVGRGATFYFTLAGGGARRSAGHPAAVSTPDSAG